MTAEERNQPTESRAKSVARRVFEHENAVLSIILVVIIVVLGIITNGLSASPTNIKNILIQSSVRGVAAMGQLFVILTGGIDLSVGGIAIFSSVLGASLITQNPDLSIISSPIAVGAAVTLMLLLGLGLGIFNGTFVSYIGVPPLIVTLAMWQIAKGGGYQVCKGASIISLPESMAFFGLGKVAGVPVPVIIFIAVAAVSYFVLNHSTFGRSVYAVGGSPTGAWLSGISVNKIRLSTYAISGILAGLSALLMTSRTMSASMYTAAGLELDSITAVVLGGVSLAGGRGNLIGGVIGVLILGVINNGMNIAGIDPSYQEMARGAIILAAVTADVIRRRK